MRIDRFGIDCFRVSYNCILYIMPPAKGRSNKRLKSKRNSALKAYWKEYVYIVSQILIVKMLFVVQMISVLYVAIEIVN